VIEDLFAIAVGSYLLGSIPSGFLLARLRNVDVRQTGSGNIGATNVARSAGKSLGILTLLFDVAKGAIPVIVVGFLGWEVNARPETELLARLVAAAATVVGHVFSIALRFRGGKGVATALGAILALAPAAAIGPVLVFAALFAVARRVSLASIGAALAAPLSSSWFGYPEVVTATIGGIAALVILRHRDNLARLIAGTEPRFGSPRDSQT
jgi:glycerol-3-phosphate acyltransferase PlsY